MERGLSRVMISHLFSKIHHCVCPSLMPNLPLPYTNIEPVIQGGRCVITKSKVLNWMVSLHHNGLNGILADKMGLSNNLLYQVCVLPCPQAQQPSCSLTAQG